MGGHPARDPGAAEEIRTVVALPDTLQRVVVLRALRGLGDMLCAVPALRALRAAAPDARITLVGLPWIESFAARFTDYIDEFAAMPGFPGISDYDSRVRELPAFLSEMQERRFDLAVQMHGSGIVSNPLAALLGATRLAGFYLPGQWCPDDVLFAPYPAGEPEPRRWLGLMRHLGIEPVGEHLEFPLTDDDLGAYDRLRRGLPFESEPFALVHPGAHDPRVRWPAERFAAVADSLAERGLRVVLTGTAEEGAVVREVLEAMRAPGVNLCGRTELGALACLIGGARIVVSNDTGTSHLAAALRTPSVVVYTGASDHQRWAPLDREMHRAVTPPASDGCACALPLEERCLRDGCVARTRPFVPHHASVAEVLGHVDSLLAKEVAGVA